MGAQNMQRKVFQKVLPRRLHEPEDVLANPNPSPNTYGIFPPKKTQVTPSGGLVNKKPKETMEGFINSLFPGTFSGESTATSRFNRETSRGMAARLIGENSLFYDRAVAGLQILTFTSMTAFLVAVFLDLQYPS